MDGELKTLLTRLLDKVEGLDAKFVAIDARFDAVDAKFVAIDARFDAVDAKIDAVDTKLSAQIGAVDAKLTARADGIDDKVEELKRVTSANHFKVIGRIDQVASMLADHMAEPHGPPAKRAS